MLYAHKLLIGCRHISGSAIASLLAGGIILIDFAYGLGGAGGAFYALPIVAGGRGKSVGAVSAWTTICTTLALFGALAGGAGGLEWIRTVSALVAVLMIALLVVAINDSDRSKEDTRNELRNMRNVADMAPIFLWHADQTGRVTFFNQRFSELTGRDVDEMVDNQSWIDILHPDDQALYLRMREEAKLDEGERQLRVRVRNPDGGHFWAFVTRRPTKDTLGNITGWIGGASNIDAEVRARDEVQRLNDTLEQRVLERTADLAYSEARLKGLLDSLNVAFVELDISRAKNLLDQAKAGGIRTYRSLVERHPEIVEQCMAAVRLLYLNDAMITMLGYVDREDWLSHQPVVPIEDPQQVLNLKLEALFEGRRQFSGSTVMVAKDGRRIPVAFGANVPSDWSTSMCTIIDISAKQQAHDAMLAAREELARANRAATIGALSTTLAHELNQPILAILVDTQTCMRWLEMDEPQIPSAMKALARLSKNADRMSGIIRRTREHLVKRERNLIPVNVAELVRETHALLERDLATRRTLVRVTEPRESPVVRADPVELQQVLINLISNAADAMQGQSADRVIDIKIGSQRCGDLIMRVEDSGPGLSADAIDSLFDPFFTTKPGGMGMGLQICRTIVESFEGKIWASNRDQGGAVIQFSLPAASVVSWRSVENQADLTQ